MSNVKKRYCNNVGIPSKHTGSANAGVRLQVQELELTPSDHFSSLINGHDEGGSLKLLSWCERGDKEEAEHGRAIGHVHGSILAAPGRSAPQLGERE